MLEKDIQKSITDYLDYKRDLYYFRAGSGAVNVTRKNGSKGFFKTGKAGVPDIVVVKDGKFIGLEVKTPTGKQSEKQKEAEAEITKCGGEYHIVTSIDDVIKALYG